VGNVIMLSGPVGAGKTTVARELIPLFPGEVSYIEGDTFWSFITKSEKQNRKENFRVIMRAMTAAAIPFARSGFDVLVDFSIPPDFLSTARKILKEVSLDYVVLRPSEAVCEARAANRVDGKIADYASYREFYRLFDDATRYTVSDDDADAPTVAERIYEGIVAGKFRVP
jgi:ABC-type oligopeptide transport system ATPase subunit